MSKVYSLLFAGVGGQGSLLIAELTSNAAYDSGHDVKQTEVHGVSQRGGSVESHVRFGQRVYSPVVTPGEADVVIGLEKLEALRFAHYLHPESGKIIINDYEIIPGSVANANLLYPYKVIDYLKERKLSVIALPASQIARDLGDGRMANMVLLGVLSNLLPISQEAWQKALRLRLPPRYLEINAIAFSTGRDIFQAEGYTGFIQSPREIPDTIS